MATGGGEEDNLAAGGENENDGDAEADKTCGICLAEGVEDRGMLESCEHIFCFPCIMEWSRVESRCPFCKRRFERITRAGVQRGPKKFRVPLRNQTYVPSEEEVAAYAEVYSETACTVCGTGDDDALLLLCDGCDSAAHTYCVGLGMAVPQGDYYCGNCRGRVDEGLLEVFGPESGGSDEDSSDSGSDFSDEDLEARLGRVVRARVPRRTARAQGAAAAAGAGPSSGSGQRAARPRRQAPAQISAGASSSRRSQSGGGASGGRVGGRVSRRAARAASVLTMQRRCALLDRVQNLRQHWEREQQGRSGASASRGQAQPGGQARAAAGGRVQQQPSELGPEARAWQMLERAQALMGRGAPAGAERSPAASVVRRTGPEVHAPRTGLPPCFSGRVLPSTSSTGTGGLVQGPYPGGASGYSRNSSKRGVLERQQAPSSICGGNQLGQDHPRFARDSYPSRPPPSSLPTTAVRLPLKRTLEGCSRPSSSTTTPDGLQTSQMQLASGDFARDSHPSMPPPSSLPATGVAMRLPLERTLEGSSRPSSSTTNPNGLQTSQMQLASSDDSGSWQRGRTTASFPACPQPHPEVRAERLIGVPLRRGNSVQDTSPCALDVVAAHLQLSQGSSAVKIDGKSQATIGAEEVALSKKTQEQSVIDKRALKDFKERIFKAVKQHIKPIYSAGDIDKESFKALAREATHTLEHQEGRCSHVNDDRLRDKGFELEVCNACVLLVINGASSKLGMRIHLSEAC